MKDETREWLKYADADLSAAADLLSTGHPSHCLMFCQQAIEKTLKALYVEALGDEPPRIHSLTRLAELLGLEVSEDQRALLADLGNLYFMLTYPGELPFDETDTSTQTAADYLAAAMEMTRWLRQRLT